MITTIVSIVLLLVGIILWLIDDKYSYVIGDFPLVVGVLSSVVGGVATAVCIVAVLGVQINKDVDYQNAIYEKEMIEYRIDHADEDIVGNELLYNDIVEFNNDLRFIKKWSDSYWTNWFFNEDIATIDYIELDME